MNNSKREPNHRRTMADTKPKTAKRGISKARLLKAVVATMDSYGLNDNSTCDELISSLEADIVKDALDKA